MMDVSSLSGFQLLDFSHYNKPLPPAPPIVVAEPTGFLQQPTQQSQQLPYGQQIAVLPGGSRFCEPLVDSCNDPSQTTKTTEAMIKDAAVSSSTITAPLSSSSCSSLSSGSSNDVRAGDVETVDTAMVLPLDSCGSSATTVVSGKSSLAVGVSTRPAMSNADNLISLPCATVNPSSVSEGRSFLSPLLCLQSQALAPSVPLTHSDVSSTTTTASASTVEPAALSVTASTSALQRHLFLPNVASSTVTSLAQIQQLHQQQPTQPTQQPQQQPNQQSPPAACKNVPVNTSVRKFECNVCQKSFKQLAHLNTHTLLHEGKRPHKCSYCEQTFSQLTHLKRHLVTHRGSSNDPLKAASTYSCHLCPRRFAFPSDLNSHINKHYSREQRKSSGGRTTRTSRKNNSPGDGCDNNGTNSTDLASCLLAYACGMCARAFQYPSQLREHMYVHTHIRRFPCGECGRRFMKEHHLKVHQQSTHECLRPYNCSICHKRFSIKANLERHLFVHSNLKTFECTVCSKRFSQPQTLKMHMISHNDIKPYQCSVCGKGLARAHNLRAHMAIHRQNKPYSCDFCSATFTLKGNLQRHHKEKHQQEQGQQASLNLPQFTVGTMFTNTKVSNLEGADRKNDRSVAAIKGSLSGSTPDDRHNEQQQQQQRQQQQLEPLEISVVDDEGDDEDDTTSQQSDSDSTPNASTTVPPSAAGDFNNSYTNGIEVDKNVTDSPEIPQAQHVSDATAVATAGLYFSLGHHILGATSNHHQSVPNFGVPSPTQPADCVETQNEDHNTSIDDGRQSEDSLESEIDPVFDEAGPNETNGDAVSPTIPDSTDTPETSAADENAGGSSLSLSVLPSQLNEPERQHEHPASTHQHSHQQQTLFQPYAGCTESTTSGQASSNNDEASADCTGSVATGIGFGQPLHQAQSNVGAAAADFFTSTAGSHHRVTSTAPGLQASGIFSPSSNSHHHHPSTAAHQLPVAVPPVHPFYHSAAAAAAAAHHHHHAAAAAAAVHVAHPSSVNHHHYSNGATAASGEITLGAQHHAPFQLLHQQQQHQHSQQQHDQHDSSVACHGSPTNAPPAQQASMMIMTHHHHQQHAVVAAAAAAANQQHHHHHAHRAVPSIAVSSDLGARLQAIHAALDELAQQSNVTALGGGPGVSSDTTTVNGSSVSTSEKITALHIAVDELVAAPLSTGSRAHFAASSPVASHASHHHSQHHPHPHHAPVTGQHHHPHSVGHPLAISAAAAAAATSHVHIPHHHPHHHSHASAAAHTHVSAAAAAVAAVAALGHHGGTAAMATCEGTGAHEAPPPPVQHGQQPIQVTHSFGGLCGSGTAVSGMIGQMLDLRNGANGCPIELDDHHNHV